MFHKLLALIVAGCLLILGFGSPPPPYLDPDIWPVLYIPLAALVVLVAWRPDRWKLRLATSIACTTSMVRGVLFVLHHGWYSPIALYIILTVLCVEFYVFHAPRLPERYSERKLFRQ